jgi:hypothetical protein
MASGVVVGNTLVLVIVVGFWAYCLRDFARTDEREMRTFSRPVWLVLLVFGSVLGGMMWLRVGRPQVPTRRR